MKNNTNKLFNLQGLLCDKMEFDNVKEQIILKVRGGQTICKMSRLRKKYKKSSSKKLKIN